jgi:glutathione S-transferase
MLLETNEIPYEFRVLNFVDNKEDAAALSKESPINKVPILILPSGERLFDSRVIANYLIEKHGLKKLSLEEENIVSAIYSIMDVSVGLFLMKIDGFDMAKPGLYLPRQIERIPRNVEYLKSWAERVTEWHYPSMSLYACLDWTERRAGTLKAGDFPELRKFMERFVGARAVKETGF